MTRNLKVISPTLLQVRGRSRVRGAKVMFWLGLLAVLLQFVFPFTVLQTMGLDPQTIKLHPATVLVMIFGTYALLGGTLPFHQRCRETPGLMLFMFAIPAISVYSVSLTGFRGAALYTESFWSAGLLALMLGPASPTQKRLLARILIALCVINVFIALYESMTSTNWFPIVIDPDIKFTETDVDFRANALYGHPLSASLITSMAIFLLFAMRMRYIFSAPIFCLLLVGLLAFGGRTALGVTLVTCALTAMYLLFRGIIRRDLRLGFAVAMGVGAIVIPILIGVIVTQTSIADRIVDTLYFDGSAEVRVTQWEVFSRLSLKNWLFGISHDNLDFLKYQIGLGGKDTDIENFWLLILLNLGAIGFFAFLAVFGTFLFHMAKYSRSRYGWLLVIVSLIIDSGSNSLGVKSSDLFCEVAFLMAMSGYGGDARSPLIARSQIGSRSWTPGDCRSL